MLTPIHVTCNGYQGILPTEHFPRFDCVVNSQREFVCIADAESLSLSDISLH